MTGVEMENTAMVQAGGSAEVARQGFGSTELATSSMGTAAAAVAAREQAVIQARYIMAERNPRNIEQFRTSLLKECKRPGFAETARYCRKVGSAFKNGRWVDEFAEGPSIRMIEAALRHYRNVAPETMTVYDSDDIRIVRCSVTDYEANVPWSVEITIEKTTEKKGTGKTRDEPPKGRIILGSRLNSNEEIVYICKATDAEVIQKQNALISRALRTQGQRLLPADIIAEAEAACIDTLKRSDKEDPDAGKRRIIDAFFKLNIDPEGLEQLLGHSLDRVTPGEIDMLRKVHTAVIEGMTWEEVLGQAAGDDGQDDDKKDPKATGKAKLANLRDKAKKPPAATKTTDIPAKSEEDQATKGAAAPEVAPSSAPTDEDEPPPLTEEEMRAQTAAADKQHVAEKPVEDGSGKRLKFGQRPTHSEYPD